MQHVTCLHCLLPLFQVTLFTFLPTPHPLSSPSSNYPVHILQVILFIFLPAPTPPLQVVLSIVLPVPTPPPPVPPHTHLPLQVILSYSYLFPLPLPPSSSHPFHILTYPPNPPPPASRMTFLFGKNSTLIFTVLYLSSHSPHFRKHSTLIFTILLPFKSLSPFEKT